MTAKQLGNLLNLKENAELGELIERARSMGRLTETLSKSLPEDLAGSLIAANIREESELVVICRNSAWASRLRFEEETLIAAARSHGVDVDKVSVRVARVDYNSGE
jgi:hypothetical protein